MRKRHLAGGIREDENGRQYRLTDQLLSMHSMLRDNYNARAFWFNTLQIGASLFLCVGVFVGDATLQSAGLGPDRARLFLGLVAVLVLLLAIAEYRVDWKAAGSRHHEAASRLARLKAKYRQSFAQEEEPGVVSELAAEYDGTMERLPPIPDRRFNELKARHEFKRMLSQRLGENPKAFKWFLATQLRLEGVRAAVGREGENGD